jgi:L-cysteate sulfo-lyase
MLNMGARVSLGHFPTPLEALDRLSRHLDGPRILVKRDDLTGLAGGGNKTRKLEFLIADALQQPTAPGHAALPGSVTRTVITAGAPQSNHARQTAAAAARYGLGCVLVLSGMAPPRVAGNLLLDDLLGARIRWTGDRALVEVMDEVAAEESSVGRTPYIIPVGGSNPIGAAAYALAMDELYRQLLEQKLAVDHIILASGSGGTQAGLIVGAQAVHYEGNILGISVSRAAEKLQRTILDLARLTAERLQLRVEIDAGAVHVTDDYLGDGYGVLGDAEREAIRLLARTEGLLLDPLYTGRAMAGLLGLIRRGDISKQETVLFWHTGGTTALDAYADALLARPAQRR